MDNTSKTIKFRIDDIACAACAGDMENILLDIEGVRKAAVNFPEGTINIQYNSEIIDRKQVFLAVRKLGYKIAVISES